MINDYKFVYLGRFSSGESYELGECRGEKVGAGARVWEHSGQNKDIVAC